MKYLLKMLLLNRGGGSDNHIFEENLGWRVETVGGGTDTPYINWHNCAN